MAVVEVTVFATTGDDAAFVAADKQMQTEWAYQQPGCLRRTTARADDGDWLVLTLWDDEGAAEAAAQAAEQHPVARAFWSQVRADTVRARRFTLLPG